MKNFVRFVSPLLLACLTFDAHAHTKWPADWISHLTPLTDTRTGGKKDDDCNLEIIELSDTSGQHIAGSILLIPGLYQNAMAYDMVPSEGTSYARWLRDTKHLRVFILNHRGLGESCYPHKSNLDDLAIDDLPTALTFVSKLVGEPIFAMGHSQGSMVLEAALAGLTRCGTKNQNCFNQDVAAQRQKMIRAAAFMAGNPTIRLKNDNDRVHRLVNLDITLKIPPLSFILDRLPASWLTKYILPSWGPLPSDESNLWTIFYKKENVTKAARKAFYDETLDATTRAILLQFANGARHDGLEAMGGEKWADQASTVRVPSVVAAFGDDVIMNPDFLEADVFDRLGSYRKQFFFYKGLGHEDFMMSSNLHSETSALINWMLRY
ncbi:MAG: alpha/beta fold hydrolase [Bdellovibrionales bacterium]|nr:alpha/beta fold hydrolase [Bdellovibrionales bacterium]